MPSKLPRRSPDSYTVGWLCALPLSELPAARMMLDHRHEPALSGNESDENVYDYGNINGHNVVIACLPPSQPGKLSTQRLVRPLRNSFPKMKLHLFVGIGGGVPRRPPLDDPELDIHLGDVVVGWADGTNVPSIIQYNRVEYLPNGQNQAPGSMEKPSRQLLQALSVILADRVSDETEYEEHLARLSGLPGFEHPGLDKDILFEAAYHHSPESTASTCDKCDPSRHVTRMPRATKKWFFTRVPFYRTTLL